jgi:F1F0 ATPase subunit 2
VNETLILASAFGAGVVLGSAFFGFLWWTVRKGLSSQHPALWFSGSFLLRMGFVLSGFYIVSGGQWERLIACLIGFAVARLFMKRLPAPLIKNPIRHSEGARNAS